MKVIFYWGKLLENLGYRHKKETKTKKDYRTSDVYGDPFTMGTNPRLGGT